MTSTQDLERVITKHRASQRQRPSRLSQLNHGKMHEAQERYYELVKQGVLQGKLRIKETLDGFEFLTPRDEVQMFIREHTGRQRRGVFLDGWLIEYSFDIGGFAKKEEIAFLRRRLAKEFGPLTPSEEMILDISLTAYLRYMLANKVELETLLYEENTDNKTKILSGIDRCLAHSLRQHLDALHHLERGKIRVVKTTKHTVLSTKTGINMTRWGTPISSILLKMIETKETITVGPGQIAQELKVDHQAEEVPGPAGIGYILTSMGFPKVHSRDGNVYTIQKSKIREGLNG